jgi:hypothetical protein
MNKRLWLLLVAVALFAVPMLAQQEIQPERVPDDSPTVEVGWYGIDSYSTGQYMDNPCTAIQDWVWVDYSAYVEGQQPMKGMDTYLFDESTQMAGMYAASGASSSNIDYSAPVSLRQYYKVNTSDNFHVVTVITFDPVYQSTTLTVETACGDGSPDSKE